MVRRPERPIGQATRGKTALNRLRQIDVYAALALENVLVGGAPLIVDVGYGAYPWTALEMADRLRRINPRLRVLGVEIDPERVAAAQPYADPPLIDFRLGGFNLRAVLNGERARLIRCYNVLRQYDESAVVPALMEMASVLEEGGVLIEGTSTPSGRLVAFDVYRRVGGEMNHAALVFGTNFRSPVEAIDFQPILPKRLIHHMLDPTPAAFFAAWQHEFVLQRGTLRTPRERFVNSVRALQQHCPEYRIEWRAGLIRRGYLCVHTALT